MKSLLIIFIIVYSFGSWANSLDEFDLSGNTPYPSNSQIINNTVSPTKLVHKPNPKNETIIIFELLKTNGQTIIITPPKVNFNCSTELATTSFENKYYKIKNTDIYKVQGRAICGKINIWTFDEQSSAGQVLSIYKVAFTAVEKLTTNNIIHFWRKQIAIKWPAGGDYYSGNTVYVTNGHHWDVVGHELGHAIYAQAKIGKTAGGSHKIDECYSATLAISEGWASYFSAWLHVSLRDQDAQFEFLVPRRAPLRFEHIPIDVCAGEKNEWRVTGFFWDIIDLSDDGEQSQATFAKVFEYGMKRKFRTTKKYARYLLKKGFDPVLMNIVWENNFLTKF